MRRKNYTNEIIRCTRCDKPLTKEMEIEYSEELTSFFCNHNCAIDYYFDYMRSIPLEGILEERPDLYFKNDKLYRKN